MLSSLFKQSPVFAIENLLIGLEEKQLTPQNFILKLEQQFSKVEVWIQRLEAINFPDCQIAKQVQKMGLEGTNLMMESLESIHEMASENDLDDIDEQLITLEEGHGLVVESLQLCHKTLEDDIDSVIHSFGCYMS